MPTKRIFRRVAATGVVLGAGGIYWTFLTPTALLKQHLKSIRNAASDGVLMPPRSSVAFVGGQSIKDLPPLHVYANMSRGWFIFRCVLRVAVLSVYLCGALVGGAAAYVGIIDMDTFGRSLAWVFQHLGPMYVKMGQWIATRPDLFPPSIYKPMEDLLETAPPHKPEDTLKALKLVPGLLESVEHLDPHPLNTGSIGQVHVATLAKPFADEATGVALPVGTKLAIKVLHPNARTDVAIDSAILCVGAYLASFVIGKSLNARAAVDEFRALLLTQLDMRRERDNLVKFRYDFRNSPCIRFPMVLPHFSTEDVLVETFEYGESVRNVTAMYGIGGLTPPPVEETHSGVEDDPDGPVFVPNPFTQTIHATLSTLAIYGLDAMLKMIFEGNFVHADLHAGNVLTRFEQAALDADGTITACHASVKDGRVMGHETKQKAHLRFGEETWLKMHAFLSGSQTVAHASIPQLVILDAGLSSTLQKADLECFVKLFATFTLQDANVGVEALEERHWKSDTDEGPKMDREGFKQALEAIMKQHDPLGPVPVNMSLLFMQLLDAMRANKVHVEANFASLLSSVIVGEGLGRQLDPKIEVFREAAPFMIRHFSASQMTTMAGRLAEVRFRPRVLLPITTATVTSSATSTVHI